MDYKQHELFKMLDGTENSIAATIDAGDHDLKFVFSVADGELQTQVFAVVGRYEQAMHAGKEINKEMFIHLCEQFDGHEGE